MGQYRRKFHFASGQTVDKYVCDDTAYGEHSTEKPL